MHGFHHISFLLQECSVFVFDKRVAEKLFKPKRKESMLERIRYCIDQLEKMRNPRMLQIIHALEENNHTFAFASESVLGSLHNILAWHVSELHFIFTFFNLSWHFIHIFLFPLSINKMLEETNISIKSSYYVFLTAFLNN